MKWTIKDKMLIGSILPKEGTLLTQVLCRDIREKLSLTPNEVKESGLEAKDGRTEWKNNIDVEIKFSNDELDLLKSSASQIDKDNEVNSENIDLIEKLIG